MARSDEDRARAKTLVRLAAEAMENGEDPFHVSFLSANAVTLDEVYDLSDTLAQAAKLYLVLLKHPEWLTVLTIEALVGPEAARTAEATIGMRKITRQLRELA